jgi:osmotically inducible lipoprotein OsmB
MKNIAIIGLLALGLSACQSDTRTERAVGGGLVGAGAGAVIGGVASGTAEGALVGAALGGAGGAILGAATTPERRRLCRGTDRYGNPIRYRC